jgi:restriction system protein
MAIPDFQSILLPLLRLAGDGGEHRFRESVRTLADQYALTPEEWKQRLPSGVQPLFYNRVAWARAWLVGAGLLQSPRRGYFRITEPGRSVLAKPPARLDLAFLKVNYPQVRHSVAPSQPQDALADRLGATASESTLDHATETPEESLEASYQTLRRAVESDVLARLQSGEAEFFERVVVRVLVAMGYGGTLRDAGKAIGRSGDEGIDGIIKEDILGLDVVYVQAKKWANPVGGPEIQKFAGALQVQHAQKGVFITTSTFSQAALAHVAKIHTKIVLIDGAQLAHYMFEYNVGVARKSPDSVYEVKKVDEDFFEEDETIG